jgi:dienelactone hydrolase
VEIAAGDAILAGDLTQPNQPIGVVVFAHGSGSSRHSPRNRFVAEQLQAAGLATLLLDLLTADEEAIDQRTANLRFDVGLLAGRLVAATRWFDESVDSRVPVGYFGASTGAGAALIAAADLSDRIGAVVSRGGRPDLAGTALPKVQAPTLLIVGGRDDVVIGMNERAAHELRCPHQIEIVPGATHLFEEPGALERVADLATAWFTTHLVAAPVQ